MISVLLPTYNSVETIKSSIQCILRQTIGQFEVLVLDDGSTDTTSEVVSTLNDHRIRYYPLKHRGLAVTLNEGLSLARYDIIARMDSDDLCVPFRFERQLTALASLPPRSIISSWYAVFSRGKIRYGIKPPQNSAEIKKGLLLHSYVAHSGVMCHKAVLKDNGGYAVRGGGEVFEDYETWLRIKDDVEFHIIPEYLVYHRVSENSLTNTSLYRTKTIYDIQQPYYADLAKHFCGLSGEETLAFRGWREFFYGSRKKARHYWRTMGWSLARHPRVITAYFLTYFHESVFQRLKQLRFKYRTMYYWSYYSGVHKKLRNTLKELLGRDNENSSCD